MDSEYRRIWRHCLRAVAAGGAFVFLLGAHCPNSLPTATRSIELNIVLGVDTAGTLCPITRVHWDVVPVAVPPRPDGSTVGTTAIDKWAQYSGGSAATNGGTAQFPVV